MSILSYNGSAIIAMIGKNCFAIASDSRLGIQQQTLATDFQKIFKIHDRLYIGLSGLASDVQTLHERFVFRHKLYKLREERDMKPSTFANLVSSMLYEKRFGPYFAEPVIAGLTRTGTPSSAQWIFWAQSNSLLISWFPELRPSHSTGPANPCTDRIWSLKTSLR